MSAYTRCTVYKHSNFAQKAQDVFEYFGVDIKSNTILIATVVTLDITADVNVLKLKYQNSYDQADGFF